MNKIIWEKWNDPFGENLDEVKWNSYDNEELDEETEFLDKQVIQNAKPIKVIATPAGLIPYNEHTASSKIFNFWVGHTNFNISKNIMETIENCEGVELLDVFTRYRFRIAVGKCFTDNEVMANITEKINGNR
jgi:hypothetical protein